MPESIEEIDLTNIENKLVYFFNWPVTNASLCCEQYRNYLKLQKKYGQKIPMPPSQCIDEVWHLHILDTRKYRKDCEKTLGYYLEHDPYYPTISETSPDIAGDTAEYTNMFQNTQELYFKEFGKKIVEARPMSTRQKVKGWFGF